MNRSTLLFITVFFLRISISGGQVFEITVLNKNSEPMPYAYILVNGKVIEITDTLGIAKIPMTNLADNDSISVSYLGASPTWITYDKTLKENKKYCFYLDESGYNLDEVVVTYQDIEKLFKRSCKYIPELNYNCILNANFDARIRLRDNTVYPVVGTLEATNEIFSNDFVPRHFGWFHLPLKFTTDSDTSRIGQLLRFHTHLALDISNRYIGLSQFQLFNTGKFKPFYSYLGEKDDSKVFRLSYSTSPNGGFCQIILFINKKTKSINSAEIEVVNPRTDSNKYLNSYTIRFDCNLFTHKKPIKNTIYLPDNLQYTFKYGDYLQADIKISEVSIKYKRY